MTWRELIVNTVAIGVGMAAMKIIDDRRTRAKLEARMTLRTADMIERDRERQGVAEPAPDPA